MTSYIDTTATAVSQIKNKPEATGLTSTTSIDMTRNNEHENNNQELKNIKTIEVNLTGLGSMKAKEKKELLKETKITTKIVKVIIVNCKIPTLTMNIMIQLHRIMT